LAVLRFIPMLDVITPPGADMSMHAYITKLITLGNGVPKNYSPILDIERFDSFPVGFHTISALISILGNIPEYRTTFIMSCLTYVLVAVFLFLFLKNFVSWEYALISSIVFTFLTANPRGFIGWGGNPTIFSLSFFIMFIHLMNKLEETENNWLIVFSALILAFVFLTHSIIFISAAYLFGVSFLVYFILTKQYRNYKWIKYLKIIILFFIISLPYLLNFDYNLVTEGAKSWIKDWVTNTAHVWHGSIKDFIWTIPLYILNYVFGHGLVRFSIIFCFLGLTFMLKKNTKSAIHNIIFIIISILLILNTKYWILPFSYSLYPERIATMNIIPLSLFLAYFFCLLEYYGTKLTNKTFISHSIIVILISTLFLAPIFNKDQFVNLSWMSSVTKEDSRAINWLKDNTPQEEIIDNNYGDAGLWIPAIISRQITNAHVNVVYLDKLKPSGEARYVYIGKKCVYNCPLKIKDFKNNLQYKQIYSEEGVFIFEKAS